MKLIDHELDWEKWKNIFQSIDFFSPFIKEIFEKEGLGKVKCISNLTPGTNAVFKVNSYVVKIFVPDEIKPWSEDDFTNEKENIKRAMGLGISTPTLIAEGFIENRYIWNYLIFEYIDAKEIKEAIENFTLNDKILLAKNIRKIVDTFNVKPNSKYDNQYIKERVILGQRWKGAKIKIRKELENLLNRLKLTESVYVHGDLTAENVMINNENDIYIIDFADSVIAPHYYEYPPIVFDLFNCDKVMIRHFFGSKDEEDIIEELYSGVLIHDFGGDISEIILKTYANKKLEDINTLEEIKDVIRKIVQMPKE